jgi:hypothetical protein
LPPAASSWCDVTEHEGDQSVERSAAFVGDGGQASYRSVKSEPSPHRLPIWRPRAFRFEAARLEGLLNAPVQLWIDWLEDVCTAASAGRFGDFAINRTDRLLRLGREHETSHVVGEVELTGILRRDDEAKLMLLAGSGRFEVQSTRRSLARVEQPLEPSFSTPSRSM